MITPRLPKHTFFGGISALQYLVLTNVVAAGVFPDVGYLPPADWTGSTFPLSQNYPNAKPAAQSYPWEAIDFRKEPARYMDAVIQYCYEGNIGALFKPEKNTVRAWYHAPWLHAGTNGREFVNGLTRERSSRPYELWQTQVATVRNYAVGFYNDQGGYTIGKVWANPANPEYQKVSFPEGTVSFKLLFTTAPDSAVPYLAGAPSWIADIDRDKTAAEINKKNVRLLQIDISVKDRRSSCGGWVFGTFHYDKDVSATNPWLRLKPLTLVWGNDPGLTPTGQAAGKKPTETWLNPSSPIAVYRANPPAGVAAPHVFGWAGRGNGPVDNPISSCLSCHSTAQIPQLSGMTPPNGSSEAAALKWFRNLAVDESFDASANSLDFSLQLGVGIQNFASAQNPPPAPVAIAPKNVSNTSEKRILTDHRFSRDPEEDPSLLR